MSKILDNAVSKSGDTWDFACPGIQGSPCGDPSGPSFTSTGWPSFDAAIADGAVVTHVDRSLGMVRTEALCGHCGAHLGHLFEDGPTDTGLRYCMNSASLHFSPE